MVVLTRIECTFVLMKFLVLPILLLSINLDATSNSSQLSQTNPLSNNHQIYKHSINPNPNQTSPIKKAELIPYSGTNYWYGGFACVDSVNGLKRVRKELDFLKKNSVTTLRVMFSAEGDSTYPYRISPSIQDIPRKYNEQILKGFDRFLAEVEKRNMKVVFVLSNNWEWSGGFGQYVEWSRSISNSSVLMNSNFNSNSSDTRLIFTDSNSSHCNAKLKMELPPIPPLPKTPLWDWDAYCYYIGSFYADSTAKNLYWDYVRHVVSRRSAIDGESYSSHPAILAWQLANEPRPMRMEQTENFVEWVRESAELIRSLDTIHLISIGVEGKIGLMNSMDLFKRVHSLPYIDFATIHLWPKTWNWYQGSSSEVFSADCINQITQYISEHAAVCRELGIPLVIEEFGLERDANVRYDVSSAEYQFSRFSPKSKTVWRDGFYALVYSLGMENGVNGYNFWGYAGLKENVNPKYFMQQGMQYSADPPQEEQGLYSVFKSDKSTWKVIRRFSNQLKSQNNQAK